MHPGLLTFNAATQNAERADKWGIVMGSSHSEALLRNNVGEWNKKTDGPWNYQTNAPAMNAYWDKRPQVIWLYKESLDLYLVGMRVHDDVTLGWTDDNCGHIRKLPNAAEQRRSGGSGVYYRVSYWDAPPAYPVPPETR